MKLRQVRPSRSGPSRGPILALPGIQGIDADILPLARNSLESYDIVSAGVELNGARVDDSPVWLAFARQLADQILTASMPRPAAFAGFSIGGYLGWVIDRLLVRAGLDPTPVINLDGGVLHLQRPSWRDSVAALLGETLPRETEGLPAEKMLLLHSAAPGGLRLLQSSLADWRQLGVPVVSLPVRTVTHADVKRPAVIRAAADAFRAFLEAEAGPATEAAREIDVATPGSRLFAALVAPERPSVATVRALLAEAFSVNPNVLASLVFLGAATGDADFALEVCRRARAASPRFAPANYAAQAVLRESGRGAGAAGGAGLQTLRPGRADAPARPWGSLKGAAIGSRKSLDFAAAFCRPRG